MSSLKRDMPIINCFDMKSFKNEIIEEMSNNSMSSEWKKRSQNSKRMFSLYSGTVCTSGTPYNDE